MSKPNIIYISGYGRSGSTLLSLLLNVHENVLNIGEAENLFIRKSTFDYPEYWLNLKKKYIQKNDNVDPIHLKFSSIKWFFRLGKGKILFDKYWTGILEEVSRDHNSKFLIDASNSVRLSFCRAIYYKLAGYPIKVIHLVRDPAGVVESFSKGQNFSHTEVLGKPRRGGGLRALYNWIYINTLTSIVFKRYIPKCDFYVLSYDQLTSNYKAEMINLFDFLSLEAPSELFEKEINLPEDISFSGNRLRLKKTITIRKNNTPRIKHSMKLLTTTAKKVYQLIEKKYV